jgi:hypothetical protein
MMSYSLLFLKRMIAIVDFWHPYLILRLEELFPSVVHEFDCSFDSIFEDDSTPHSQRRYRTEACTGT